MTELDFGSCPRCSTGLSPDDYDWEEGSTEAGTSWFNVEVTCSSCDWKLSTSGWSDVCLDYCLPIVQEEFVE